METTSRIIEMISCVSTIVNNARSFTKEQIAVTIISLILLSYLAALIHFYEESKKNHSYGNKSDSDIK